MMLDEFLKRVATFLEEHQMAKGTFGDGALGDRNFLFDVQAGRRKPRVDTMERAIAWMKTYTAPPPRPPTKRKR